MHRYLLGLLLCLEGAALSGVASSPSVPQTAQSGVQPAIRAANALVGDGSLLTNLNEVRAEHVTVLELPTMDGTNSVTHPNLLLSERLVGGYRYWLTYTPFPLANREWVSIAASHDLTHWEVPAGMRSNVLMGASDLSPLGLAGGWWADPEIIEHPDGQLVVFGLAQCWKGRPVTNYVERLYMRQSQNGVDWGNFVVCFGTTNQSRGVFFAGPEAVVWTNGLLRLYYVDDTLPLTNRLCFREARDWTLTNWSSEVRCSYPVWTNAGVAFEPWHGELRYADGTLHWLVSHKAASWHTLYYATSKDGINFTWTSPSGVIAKSGTGFDDGGWYKPTGLLKANPPRWDLLLGTYRLGELSPATPWKIELRRDVTLPMQEAEWVYWSSNTWQAPVVPPASTLSAAAVPRSWKGLTNWFIGNRFSVTVPTVVRYANIYWSGNTGRVAATLFRLGNDRKGAALQATADSVAPSGRRFDFGRMVLPPGDYVLGLWSDCETLLVYYGTGALSLLNARLALAYRLPQWPPPSWACSLDASEYYLQGITLDGDYP